MWCLCCLSEDFRQGFSSTWGLCCLCCLVLLRFDSLIDSCIFCAATAWKSVLKRPCLGVAIRFGEASHPGPGDVDFGFCITNPTSLSNKAGLYVDLLRSSNSQFVSCSETSATEAVQKAFAVSLRGAKVKSLWGPPVAPSKITLSGIPSLKGKASGVALLGTQPMRPSRQPFPDDWKTTTRALHSVLQLGCSHIQVMVLYGQANNCPYAMEFNNQLMDFALGQLSQVPLPWIVMGDFNCKPEDFTAWAQLEAKGCQHLLQLHTKLKATDMPASCKSSTNPDNAIFSPALTSLVHDIQVLDSSWLATHRPVCFRLRIPSNGLHCHRLRFPKSFVDLGITEEDLELAVQSMQPLPEISSLREWGELVESVVDTALRSSDVGVPHLPKAYRGRCVPVKPLQMPIHSPVRKASHGDYEPKFEVVSFASRRKVKQMRRIDSLVNRLKKLETMGPSTPTTLQEIQHEWEVILRCTAFGSSFLHWALSWHAMDFPAWPLPSATWTSGLAQLVRHHTDAAIYQDSLVLRDRLNFAREIDKKSSHKQAYAAVRGPGNPPVVELQSKSTFEAIAVQTDDAAIWDLFVDANEVSTVCPSQPVFVDGVSCRLLHVHSHHLTVHCQGYQIPESCTVEQHRFHFAPDTIGSCLNEFWQPIWQRDSGSTDFLRQPLDLADFPSLQHLSQEPDIPVRMDDPQLWIQAVRGLRSGSARGIDSISAQELKLLPQSLIGALSKVFGSLTDGFDKDWMVGLTCPLAKTAFLPFGHQTSPVTVLPQLYRLWARVACSQLSKHFASVISPDVAGLLPGRGSADTAYRSQFHIEASRFSSQHCSGVTLDLVKCFNNMSWRYVFTVMRLHGIPLALLRAWFLSLSRLCRIWILLGHTVQGGPTTTGLPEGDVWAVIAMILVAAAWAGHLRTRFQLQGFSQDALDLSAYADNWGWIVSQPGHHGCLMDATESVALQSGLAIDFEKTWFWCTDLSQEQAVGDSLSTALNGKQLHCKQTSSDLGFNLHYSGHYRKGINALRIDKGLQRLHRLKSLQLDVATKAHMIRSSVWPAALYGVAIRPPSSDTLDKLRSSASQALLGHCPNASAVLALLCAPNGILDPEFWTFAHIIRTARLFLLRASQRDRSTFLRMAARFQGLLSQVRGPASALGFCLLQLGWSIDSSGLIHVSAFLSFDLCGVSFQRLRRFLILSWQQGLIMAYTQRKSWYHQPDISSIDTVQVLRKFPAKELRMLMRENSGGFQDHIQKSHWLQGEDGRCPYCMEEDTREHRLRTCSIGSEAREPYAELFQQLDLHGFEIPNFPFATVHPLHEALQCLQFSFELPLLDPAFVAVVEDCRSRGVELHWFTDGSCQHSHCVLTRHSAFAVALDLCVDDASRQAQAVQAEILGKRPSTFQKVVVGRTSGEQDILRAEMQAVVFVLLNAGYGTVHVDNQSAITLLSAALLVDDVAQLAGCEHFDLLSLVWQKRGSIQCRLEKVKAHVEISAISSPIRQYWSWGNSFVNDLAQEACLKLFPDYVRQCEQLHKESELQKGLLFQAYQLQVELQILRIRAWHSLQQSAGTEAPKRSDIELAYIGWNPDPCRSFDAEVDIDFFHFSMYGGETLEKVLRWMRCLKWPAEDTIKGPLGHNTGVSWVELALSYMFFHDQYLPALRQDDQGQRTLVNVRSYEHACELGLGMSECGTMLQKCWDNLIALTPQSVLIVGKRMKISSLYHLGYVRYLSGVNIRCGFPCSDLVISAVKDAIDLGGSFLERTPKIPCGNPATCRFDNTYDEALKKCAAGQYHVRKRRKELGA